MSSLGEVSCKIIQTNVDKDLHYYFFLLCVFFLNKLFFGKYIRITFIRVRTSKCNTRFHASCFYSDKKKKNERNVEINFCKRFKFDKIHFKHVPNLT